MEFLLIRALTVFKTNRAGHTGREGTHTHPSPNRYHTHTHTHLYFIVLFLGSRLQLLLCQLEKKNIKPVSEWNPTGVASLEPGAAVTNLELPLLRWEFGRRLGCV